jgi:hypothetical protein
MNKNKNNVTPIEAILRTYSIVSDREDDILCEAVLKNISGDVWVNPEKERHLLERFSEEKPFGDMIAEAMSNKQINMDTLSGEISISKNILKKVRNDTSLPNIIPVKKMKTLLQILNIPIERAVESIRTSLNRFNAEASFVPTAGTAMSRGRKRPFIIANTGRSKEGLKRGIDAYIKRLMDEEK